jgi:hypothetical protein
MKLITGIRAPIPLEPVNIGEIFGHFPQLHQIDYERFLMCLHSNSTLIIFTVLSTVICR